MQDARGQSREIVELLEAGELDDVLARVAPQARASMQPDVLSRWAPGLDGAIGGARSIGLIELVDEAGARVVLRGERGAIAVTVRFDDVGRVVELGVAFWVEDGVRNVVIGCPATPEADRRLADFYAAVLGMQIVREDWLKVGKDLATFPHLAFGDGWDDARPPRWRDPDYPHQMHLEVEVGGLDAAVAEAAKAGGSVLESSEERVVLADPFGHPLYLRAAPSAGREGQRTLAAVGMQCAEPEELAAFWGGLLGMDARREQTTDRLVIAGAAQGLMLAFERVPGFVPPRWHDPNFPEQIHLDLHFNDPDAARSRAEELGATPLPPPRGSCPVYADPAGHPFCLCSSAGGETVPYSAVIGG